MKRLPHILDAAWAESLPDRNGVSMRWKVGDPVWDGRPGNNRAFISRITVQDDLPGPSGMLRRVCIWVGSSLAVELPLHSLQGVGYPIPKDPNPTPLERTQ